MERALNRIYHDPSHPGSLGGVNKLQSAAKEAADSAPTLAAVKNYLLGDDTYTLHAPARRHFPRNRVLVKGIDNQFQADLVDMTEFVKENDGVKYLLTCIDVFSKYAWVRPLKSKSAAAVTDSFRDILAEGRIPDKLQTDRGTEFYNQTFKKLTDKHGIIHFSTGNETKASVVERFNRTLKTRMWRYLTSVNSRRYIDVIDELVKGYNNAYHRSIKTTPASVNKNNEKSVLMALYKTKSLKYPVFKFNIGDKVRISKHRGTFRKGYEQSYTDEYFIVTQRLARTPAVYKLKDLAGEDLTGTFYEQELQRILVDKTKTFKIEKILDRRGVGEKSQVLIKWLGWPDKFNSWIPSKNVVDLSLKK